MEDGTLSGHELDDRLEAQESVLLLYLLRLPFLDELNRNCGKVVVDRAGLEHQQVSVLNPQLQSRDVLDL